MVRDLPQTARGLFSYFTRHLTAANLLLVIMLVLGAAAIMSPIAIAPVANANAASGTPSTLNAVKMSNTRSVNNATRFIVWATSGRIRIDARRWPNR